MYRLFLLADTWEDIKDEHGRCLIIGEYHFSTKENVGFVASNKVKDVLAASAVNYKKKFQKGIISSWEGYNDNHVNLTISLHSIRISEIV